MAQPIMAPNMAPVIGELVAHEPQSPAFRLPAHPSNPPSIAPAEIESALITISSSLVCVAIALSPTHPSNRRQSSFFVAASQPNGDAVVKPIIEPNTPAL